MNRDLKDVFLFIFPLIIFVSVFLLFPVIGTFRTSLWQDVSFLPEKFIGFENYLRLSQDPQFFQSVKFTLLFSLISVTVEIILAIIVALIIHENFPGRGLIRGIALLPWAIPSVIGARVWQVIFNYDYGLANHLLRESLGISINWLGSPVSSFFSLLIADVWRTTPFAAIIILAGLQAIPEDLYKQAKIDGANITRRFFNITLPILKPVIIVTLLFRTIDALRVFDIIYVITGGGPGGATTSASYYGYKYFLLGDFGYGSAISIILFIISFIIALFYIKTGKFKEIF